MEEEYGQCPYCGKLNRVKPCGYFWCPCKNTQESVGMWYLPLEIYNKRQKRKALENKPRVYLEEDIE